MISLDQALFDCQSDTSDTTADSQSKFITWLDEGYQKIIATFGRPGIEKTVNTTTNIPSNPFQESDRSYGFPPDYLFLKTAKIQIGSRWYNLIEEESREMWNYRTEYLYGGIPSLYFLEDNYGVSSAELQIDPICTATSTSGTPLTPASGSLTNTTLSLTLGVSPPWSAGQWITLANFTLNTGINVNGNYQIGTVVSNTITVTVPQGVTSTITTMGTVTTTTGVPMKITYESSDIRLDHLGLTPNPAYSFQTPAASNVTFTYNSSTITSSASIFANWMALGSTYITPGADGDGNWYKITAFNSPTNITVGNVYQRTTVASSNNWSINQIMSLHVDMQDIPEDWAMHRYYKYKKDAKWRDYYLASFNAKIQVAKGNWATKSRSSIIRSKNGLSRWHAYPGWWPAVGVSS